MDPLIHGGNYINAIELACLINFIYSIEADTIGFSRGKCGQGRRTGCGRPCLDLRRGASRAQPRWSFGSVHGDRQIELAHARQFAGVDGIANRFDGG
ncbi:MAG: hypothetical protein RXR52_13065, partial [Paraburkholderia sp.]|uniref:hypothetical protein n=1 Tax=Paraburkholderia sp. TaxID=1926495 RepID=UPI00397B7AB8